jgi:hypothetical protein
LRSTLEQVPYLRVQAEGYETVETQIQLTNGLEAIRDFQLKHQSVDHSIRGTVLLPDGSAAVGVEVALCNESETWPRRAVSPLHIEETRAAEGCRFAETRLGNFGKPA